MQLSGLRYLVALADERHFARAAQRCGVSQPSLSAGLASLEEQLGRRLVERDRRFVGLTAEGRAVLPWARQITAAADNLRRTSSVEVGPLRGEMRLGIIPAAQPVVSLIIESVRAHYPDVELSIASLPSREIVRRLGEHALDAGITYVEHEPPRGSAIVPLYQERSVLVAARGADAEPVGEATWSAVLRRPLCLLHQGMQNRRILDANLAARGEAVRPVATADSYIGLLALVRTGSIATIMPDTYVPLLPAWAQVSTFADPLPPSAVGMIVPDAGLPTAMGEAALEIARRVMPE